MNIQNIFFQLSQIHLFSSLFIYFLGFMLIHLVKKDQRADIENENSIFYFGSMLCIN